MRVVKLLAWFAGGLVILTVLVQSIDRNVGSSGLSLRDEEKIRTGVSAYMKDPASTKLTRVAAGSGLSEIAVCGAVNAKNSFGAYTGEVVFSAYYNRKNGMVSRVFISTSVYDDEAILKNCIASGVVKPRG